jgi:hypothetical protein
MHSATSGSNTDDLCAAWCRPATVAGDARFADRAPSYEFLVFEFATGAFIGTQHLLRPDI